METESHFVSDLPIPPGEYLEEVVEELGISKGELATRMGRPLPKLSAIFSGKKAITPDTALQLERVTGVGAHIWTGLENDYRLSQARRRARERETQCKAETPLVTKFCYRQLVVLGLVPQFTRGIDKVKAMQEFFGVMSLHSVLDVPRYQVAHRHGAREVGDRSPEAVAAWLRVGEVKARAKDCAPFDGQALKSGLAKLRGLTSQAPETFSYQLEQALSESGVAFVPCPHFPKTKAHGATFFQSKDRAVVMLSLRYKWGDIFWFTLFHELGHLLLHSKKDVILEDKEKTIREEEADVFARDQLIPAEDWTAFTSQPRYTSNRIREFASQTGISAGIVVGRLQHEKRILPSAHNELRQRYQFAQK
ncbi:MAG: HigA family addiction module antidote protein [Verrucomicrobia bacterium]|jgi:HTH-type transcriptional regulator / antitoxin HigA|nr:HigA family addiction module antidote protein [Verrucomicrobiota bacterium]MBT7066574.1 HigA family addiction module antidote protein [Verrucomicrobiota bacterium]MBT7702095.1 HigA family addiction module antidote protein [Verrucomicrobiota bacterium]